MANVVRETVPVTGSAAVADAPLHYVEWGAIFAGAFLAAAISFVFLTFGSAVGLTLVSPYTNEGISLAVFVVISGIWMIWVQVSSFMAGGYLAGRLRRRLATGAPHEVEMRDGAHGLVVWALGIVVGGLLLSATLTGAVTGVTKTAVQAGATAASDGAASGPFDYTIDRLFRGREASSKSAVDRAEIGRLLTVAVGSKDMQSEKDYLSRLVAEQTGLSQPEAAKRVEALIAEVKQSVDQGRKMGIVIAFVTVASLIVSALAAWWAATQGGRHRDEGTDFSRLVVFR